MAALTRPENATYTVQENVTIDTADHEDHTFCGIMFPIKAKDLLPIDHLVIKSVAVRGTLGPVTVWISKPPRDLPPAPPADNNNNANPININDIRANTRQITTTLTPNNNNNNAADGGVGQHEVEVIEDHSVRLHSVYWDKLFDKEVPPCPRGRREYKELVFDEPVRLKPGETRVLYIHSTREADDAIVYDNSYYGDTTRRYEDDKLLLLSGRAHVSPIVFGQNPIWGWGNAWRDRREFVGQVAYGTVYKLWNPDTSLKFGEKFRSGCRALFLCQRRVESPMSILPDECLFYVLNMLRWDWFDDDPVTMRARRKKEKERAAIAAAAAASTATATATAVSPAATGQESIQANGTNSEHTVANPPTQSATPSSVHVCTRSRAAAAAATVSNNDDDSEDVQMADSDSDDDDDEEDEEVDSDAFNSDELPDDDDEEEDDSDDDSVHAQYHTATRQRFSFRIADSDNDNEDEDEDEDRAAAERRGWMYRQVARMNILRALAMDDA
mmetsp:Transcript_60054/g.147619  ORF Transcript_60054/g.147619 Transcript_60054/m.147619 type:complete len:500 (-) Transcript_60054:5753-7252(-)